MASASERLELAKLCSTRNWSKAIRVLDSLLVQSSSVQDICNRAFCYSQLELHKHVIKDCDRALQLDPKALQAYILKGNALSALGRKEDALLVWEEGYGNAVHESTDLKQLLELEELLAVAKQSEPVVCEDHAMDASTCDTKVVVSENHVLDSSNTNMSTTEKKVVVCEDHVIDSSSTTTLTSEIGSFIQSKSDNMHEKPNDTAETCSRSNETIKINRKLFVGLPKTKSISLDFRLSRGIAQVSLMCFIIKFSHLICPYTYKCFYTGKEISYCLNQMRVLLNYTVDLV
ncbi:suppressor of RPS4-RLD 1-like [Phoenix dactylifera]|uniref:Suppressor of RPS4-RLD 1-like n=1 Tax=Phoenix dactylifera TaxID=42345 RepID=A0A8B8ZEU0_PHODC|nr:suppressor of RPS4-RLD 1-like [Phoenix dactylifera]